MAVLCVAAEHGGLTKKESSWVKFKAFPTNVGRPNKSPLPWHMHSINAIRLISTDIIIPCDIQRRLRQFAGGRAGARGVRRQDQCCYTSCIPQQPQSNCIQSCTETDMASLSTTKCSSVCMKSYALKLLTQQYAKLITTQPKFSKFHFTYRHGRRPRAGGGVRGSCPCALAPISPAVPSHIKFKNCGVPQGEGGAHIK